MAEPHVVGGLLRDALLGRATRDLDLAFVGDALPVARRLADSLGGVVVVLDEPRQIARVVVADGGGEVVAKLDIASMQGDVLQDMARRDFTVDAMAVPLSLFLTGDWRSAVVDPFDGRGDLERGLIRAVGPRVFREDGARLLRAIRLRALLGFELEEQTRELICQDAEGLDGVAPERLRDEFLAILTSPGAMRSLYLMDELGLLGRLLPELEQGRGVQQPREHYWDVFYHNVETVGAIEGLLKRTWEPSWVLDEVPWDRTLEEHFREVHSDGYTRGTLCKLAGLLHDIAKPATRTMEASGRIRFFGHHTQGAEMARVALSRLRLSRRGIELVEKMIELHLRPGQMSQRLELPTTRAVYRFFRRAGDSAIDVVYLNLADYLAARGPYLEREEWSAYVATVRYALETGLSQEETATMPKLLDGHDLMNVLNIGPGPRVGELLEALREARAAGEITNGEEALALARRRLAAGEAGEPDA